MLVTSRRLVACGRQLERRLETVGNLTHQFRTPAGYCGILQGSLCQHLLRVQPFYPAEIKQFGHDHPDAVAEDVHQCQGIRPLRYQLPGCFCYFLLYAIRIHISVVFDSYTKIHIRKGIVNGSMVFCGFYSLCDRQMILLQVDTKNEKLKTS